MKKLLSVVLLSISASCTPSAYAYTSQQCDEMVQISNKMIMSQAQHETLWGTFANFPELDVSNNPLHETVAENFIIYYTVTMPDEFFMQYFPEVIDEWCRNDPDVNWSNEFQKWLDYYGHYQ